MATGKSNAAIAEELVLTKRAVEKHVGAIFLKLGLPGEDAGEPPRRRRPALSRGRRAPRGRAATATGVGAHPRRTPVNAIARAPRRWQRAGGHAGASPHRGRPAALPRRRARRHRRDARLVSLAEVPTGEDALALFDRLQPDFVLVDVGLPGINGLETSRRLTASEPAPVVLLISAQDDAGAAGLRARLRCGGLRLEGGAAARDPARGLGATRPPQSPRLGDLRAHPAGPRRSVVVPGAVPRYEIRVRGRVSEAALAARRGHGRRRRHPETVLHGPVADQTGLHGLLDRIQSLGLELVEVRRLPPARPQT